MSENFNEAAERQAHVLRRDEDGKIDSFALDFGFHNGPGCINCGETWCEHCVRPENIMPCIGKEAADARDKGARREVYERLRVEFEGDQDQPQ